MNDIALSTRSEVATAAVRELVRMPDLTAFFSRAFASTMSQILAQGSAPAGPPFAMYHGMPSDTADVEAGFPVTVPVKAADGVRPGALPGGRAVEAVHVGPYETLGETYARIQQFFAREGLRPATVMWEEYLSDPDAEPDPATWRTRIFWPVDEGARLGRMIVGVGRGPATGAALEWAAQRAALGDYEVLLTTVIPEEYGSTAHLASRLEADRLLASAQERLEGAAGQRPAVTEVLEGSIGDRLLDAAQTADLLVVGSDHAGRLTGLLHATLALEIAGRTPCPMVVVPIGWADRPGPVVVGLAADGSSDAAVEWGAREAAATGRPLRVVHSRRGQKEEVAAGQLARTVDALRRQHPDLVVRSTLSADSAIGALDAAASRAGVVVLGSHGRGPLADFILGSVGTDVIRYGSCPVVIVPGGDRKEEGTGDR